MKPRPWTERFLVPALRALLTKPREQIWLGIGLATLAVIAVAPSPKHSGQSAGSYASTGSRPFATATKTTPTATTPNQPHSAHRPLAGPLPEETAAKDDDFGVIH